MEVFAYGNNNQMVIFEITVCKELINGLQGLGYLEEGDFCFEDYVEVYDAYESQEMAIPVRDGVIDFYDDKVYELEDELGKGEERDYFDSLTNLEKLMYANDIDNFLDCVRIVETDPKNPYRRYGY